MDPDLVRRFQQKVAMSLTITAAQHQALIAAIEAAERAVTLLTSTALAPARSMEELVDVEQYWTPEYVVGHRLWNLGGKGRTLLVGPNGHPWRNRTIAAHHIEGSSFGRSTPHSSPHWGCACGINAAKTFLDLRSAFSLSDPTQLSQKVTGTIEMWGTVHEYQRGYRASHAQIQSLTLWYQSRPTWIDRVHYSPVDIREYHIGLKRVLEQHYKVPVSVSTI